MSDKNDDHAAQMHGLAKLLALLNEAEVEALTGGAPSRSPREPDDARGNGGSKRIAEPQA